MTTIFLYPKEREYGVEQLWLTREDDGSLSLCHEHWITPMDEAFGLGHMDLPEPGRYEETVTGLRDGEALWRAVFDLLGEGQIDREEVEWVVDRLAQVAPEMVPAFRAAHGLASDRFEAALRAIDVDRELALVPYRATIAAYVARFPDESPSPPGWGQESGLRRDWVTWFIEEYTIDHGALPTGVHSIGLPWYGGGEHDFSDLPRLHAELSARSR